MPFPAGRDCPTQELERRARSMPVNCRSCTTTKRQSRLAPGPTGTSWTGLGLAAWAAWAHQAAKQDTNRNPRDKAHGPDGPNPGQRQTSRGAQIWAAPSFQAPWDVCQARHHQGDHGVRVVTVTDQISHQAGRSAVHLARERATLQSHPLDHHEQALPMAEPDDPFGREGAHRVQRGARAPQALRPTRNADE